MVEPKEGEGVSGKRTGYKVSDWHRLYREGWKALIVPDAFTHPAKYARALIRHIYQHAISEGWARAGSRVIDPFGGVGLGALDAMRLGLHWTGLELEPRFVDLGNANLALWNNRYGAHFARWGRARLLCGDSRNLAAIVGAADLLVSSPPYADSDQDYAAGWRHFHSNGREPLWKNDRQREAHYGQTPGQLAAMPEGRFEIVVSSPPFGTGDTRDRRSVPGGEVADAMQRAYTQDNQGVQPGNLAGLHMGEFELAVGSPPFGEVSGDRVDPTGRRELARSLGITNSEHITPIQSEAAGQRAHASDYGATPGQLGRPDGDDFWTAARVIVEQTYTVLAPGGHACWVVKDFVRNKQRVPFADQWRQLCEAVGFRTLHLHRAWVVEHRGAQYGLDGELVTSTVERKSFFRRLAEKKGSPRIDWETVLCMEKVTP